MYPVTCWKVMSTSLDFFFSFRGHSNTSEPDPYLPFHVWSGLCLGVSSCLVLPSSFCFARETEKEETIDGWIPGPKVVFFFLSWARV